MPHRVWGMNVQQIFDDTRHKGSYEYVDDGPCKKALARHGYRGKCLDCPLPVCLEEPRTGGGIDLSELEKRRRLVRLLLTEYTPAEIAQTLRVKRDVVYYDIRKIKQRGNDERSVKGVPGNGADGNNGHKRLLVGVC